MQIAAFSIVYLALVLFLNGPVDRWIVQIGQTYAPWTYYQSPLDYFEQRGLINQSAYQIDALTEPNENDNLNNDVQIQPAPNGGVFVRDMTLVNTLRAMRLPLAIAVYLGVLVLLFSLSLRRVLFYFDDLSLAVQRMLLEPTQEVELPSELGITQKTLEQVRREKAAREEEARDAEKRKNELVAYLAHDIRTPLTSVIGYLDLLREEPEEDTSFQKRKHYLDVAWEKSLRLNDLVNEFFEITRLNVDGNTLLIKPVNLELVVAQVLEELWPQAEEKHLTYETHVDASLEIVVDPRQFARALSNVVKNAIAYANESSIIEIGATFEKDTNAGGTAGVKAGGNTEGNAGVEAGDKADVSAGGSSNTNTTGSVAGITDGSDRVSASNTMDTSAPTRLVALSVSNRGKGIAQENLERIFERFYREDQARQIARGGAGLGLSIASEIMRAHGGSIKASSAAGKTTFILYVPVHETASKSATADSRSQHD